MKRPDPTPADVTANANRIRLTHELNDVLQKHSQASEERHQSAQDTNDLLAKQLRQTQIDLSHLESKIHSQKYDFDRHTETLEERLANLNAWVNGFILTSFAFFGWLCLLTF